MRKFIQFTQQISDPTTGKQWLPGVKYGIARESAIYYYLANKHVQQMCILKSREGELFKTGNIIPYN